jgi:hypothetical protein
MVQPRVKLVCLTNSQQVGQQLLAKVFAAFSGQQARQSRNSNQIERSWFVQNSQRRLIERRRLVIDGQRVLRVLVIATNIYDYAQLTTSAADQFFRQKRRTDLLIQLDGVQENIALQELGVRSFSGSLFSSPFSNRQAQLFSQ